MVLPRASRRFDIALVLILLFGALLRLQYLDRPLAEAHRWRSVTNLDIARNFSERSMNLFYPQVSWGGAGEPYVGMEFPLLQWSLAVLYKLFGEHEILARLVSIAFSLGTIWAVYALGKRMFGAPAGRAAAFLIAISPSAVFFGRIFLSDTPMVFFSVLGVLGWIKYLDDSTTKNAVLASIATALAMLVKIPAIMILVPITWAALETRRWAVFRDIRFLVGVTLAVAAAGAWYLHADLLYHRTGLGEAIWHPSGNYAPGIAVAAGAFGGIYHWSSAAQMIDPDFYRVMLARMWGLHLTPAGIVFILVALFAMWRVPRRHVLDTWILIMFVFMLVTAEGNRNHEFHQLPLLPPAALMFGLAAAPAFNPDWLRADGRRRLGLIGGVIAIALGGWLSFYYSGVINNFFRPNELDLAPIAAGRSIESVTAPDELVVTVEYDQFGNNSPILLYWAHRRGWSFDFGSITPHVVERLHSHFGADYFTTTLWEELKAAQPVLADYLMTRRRVDLPGGLRNTVMFDLRQPAAGLPGS